LKYHKILVDLCQSVSSVALDNIFDLPAEVFSLCLAIVSAVMVGGLFLWPALQYETGRLPDSLRDPTIKR